jgi:FtsH-binding integral membrane protein
MNSALNPSSLSSAGPLVVAERNRVLRNTYWLLALSLIPTVLGAAVGMASGISQVMASSPVMTVIIFLAGAFGLMFAIVIQDRIEKYPQLGTDIVPKTEAQRRAEAEPKRYVGR